MLKERPFTVQTSVKDCEQHGKKVLTRSAKQESLTEMNRSAIADHSNSTNHVIDWERANLIDKEIYQKTRQIKEAIHIRLQGAVINCLPQFTTGLRSSS